MEKLEILEQFINRYGNKINPMLRSIKYCQSVFAASVEMNFSNSVNPVVINLDFIGGKIVKDEEGNDADILPMFNPDADIVDNAKSLIELDEHSLIMCIDNLFTEEVAKAINEQNIKTNKA